MQPLDGTVNLSGRDATRWLSATQADGYAIPITPVISVQVGRPEPGRRGMVRGQVVAAEMKEIVDPILGEEKTLRLGG